MTERKIKLQTVYSDEPWLDCKLEVFVKKMTDHLSSIPQEFRDSAFIYSDDEELEIFYEREETDEEMACRIEREELLNKSREESEREQLKKLLEKYPDVLGDYK